MVVNSKRYSLFWPIVLIGAGVILLLRNLGFLPAFNWSVMLQLWPLVLVVIGLDLLFGYKAPWVGGLIGLLTVAAAIAFLYFSPSLGMKTPEGIQTEVVSSPLGNTESVEYYLDTSAPPVTLYSLPGSSDLINGTIVHRGQVNFDVKGETAKTVLLSTTTNPDSWISLDFGFAGQKWDVGLNPSVPSTINLNGGSGSLDLDLDGITLEALRADLGSGSSEIVLPSSLEAYEVEIESGSGSVELTLAANTDTALSLDSGSGSVTVFLPRSSGVRIEVHDDGSGSVRLADEFDVAVLNTESDYSSWQTANFDTAASTITIQVTGRGSGSLQFKMR